MIVRERETDLHAQRRRARPPSGWAAVLIFLSGTCAAGVGMNYPPVDAGSETCTLNINSALPTGILPFGYHWAPSTFLDASNMVSGSCTTSPETCPTSGPSQGQINEQDGRLVGLLRLNAQTQDAKAILVNAVWTYLGLASPGLVSTVGNGGVTLTPCGGAGQPSNKECAKALAQLAVTGRQAYNSFVAWNPLYAPSASGPQPGDLMTLVTSGYPPGNIPAIGAAFSSQVSAASTFVLTQAYTALWAIRSNRADWRQYRAGMTSGEDWIAASGEDDTPHRPVNVPTAPFPQFDLAVPVNVNGTSYTLTTRYMIASARTMLPLKLTRLCVAAPCTFPTHIRRPPLPEASPCVRIGFQMRCHRRLAVPDETALQAVQAGDLTGKDVIIYVHGGGSRLEEAVPFATKLATTFRSLSQNLYVISFDLPNSAYADQLLHPTAGGAAVTLDGGALFEDHPAGNIYNYPVLNFTLNFINNFILALANQGIISAKGVRAVIGGSLGGNTTLLLGASANMPINSAWSPFAPALSLTTPASYLQSIVSWSPTSMVSYVDDAKSTAGIAAAGIVPNALSAPDWGAEVTGGSNDSRSSYFYHLYFTPTTEFAGIVNLGGLPPDPEMWYRSDWFDQFGNQTCEGWMITQSRFDRYEVYSGQMRNWTTAIDTEQAIFSFQTNTDTSNNTYAPIYNLIQTRVLLLTGACDDYDNSGNTAPFSPPPTLTTGSCNGAGLGNTGSNLTTHQDIYGFTHDVANDMRAATGTALFLNDTGHSIHDERPAWLAGTILGFLNTPDSNVNVTLLTNDDGLRWNSEVHLLVGFQSPPGVTPAVNTVIDLPINYWFHPLPAWLPIPGYFDPCGACEKLTAFQLPPQTSSQSMTENNFTVALPFPATWINSFAIHFISGQSAVTDWPDHWHLGAVAACVQGSSSGFVSDGFPISSGTLKDFGPNDTWSPPSFQAPANASLPNNCNQSLPTNPPANSDVPGGIWSGTLLQVQ